MEVLRWVLRRQYEALDKTEEEPIETNGCQMNVWKRENNNLSTGVIFLFSSLSLVLNSALLPETRLSDPNNSCSITI